jgi:hypothetical protein
MTELTERGTLCSLADPPSCRAATVSEPGVVSSVPVSSHVVRPDKIIRQPPYRSDAASLGSSSWTTVRRHESPTVSISQVTREVPAPSAASLQWAWKLCTSRLGGSTSRCMPSTSIPYG